MKRVVWVVFFIWLCTCTVAAAGPKKLLMSDGDEESLVTLDKETYAEIELWCNPSTGHRWETDNNNNSHLKIVGKKFESSDPGKLGAWGKQKIYVVSKSEGRDNLIFHYRRPSQGGNLDTVKFKFNCTGKFQESLSISSDENETDADSASASQLTASTSLGLPTQFNWCNQGACTPVRDQGSCGGCWAFATVAPLESLIKKNDGVTVNLSEQYLISCNAEGWGCDGGNWAHDYHQWKTISGENDPGAVLESNFAYKATDAACNPPHDKAYQIASWSYVCGNANCTPTTDQIKQAIYDHGPLSVGVCVNSEFQNYTGGVFTGPGCSALNHGVVLVGWDDNNSCWIMRNSWGSSWGESGYMRIRYGVSGIGSLASYVSYEGSDDPDPDPDPEPEENEITNGQTVSNLSAAQGEWLYYFISVPEDAANLRIKTSGGTGDMDLYTRFGAQPTVSDYTCRPYMSGNNETCTYSSPRSGKYYIGLRADRAFSGLRLTASYDDASDTDTEDNELTNGQTVSNLETTRGQWLYYYIDVPDGATNLRIRISGGSGDADLYTRFGSQPTKSNFNCRPYRNGNNETCTNATPRAGAYHIGIKAYRSFSGLRLNASYD